MLKIIGVILIAIGIVSFGIGLYQDYQKNNIMDGPGMVYEPDIVSLSYYHGGSSLGDLYRIDLKGDSFSVAICEGNGYKTKEKTYDIGASIYHQLDNVIETYHIKSWTNLEKSEIVELDGSATYLYIEFNDGLKIELHNDDQWPTGASKAINEIVTVFESNMK